MDIYTRKGDDGTTGLFYGGRVSKASDGPEAYGTVDEAVAALGTARAMLTGDVADAVLARQRELFVVGAELATAPANRHKLEPEKSRTSAAMVDRLEAGIDAIVGASGLPGEFVVPGEDGAAAALDVARTIVRRAERRAVSLADAGDLEDSEIVRYLNRLADYLYVLARSVEGEWTPSRREEET